MSWFSSLYSEKEKVRDRYLDTFSKINKEYELDIPYNDYYAVAEALGKEEGKTWLGHIIDNPALIVGAVLAVVSAIYTSGTSLYVYAAWVSAAISVAGVFAYGFAKEKSVKLETAINAALSGTAMTKAKEEAFSQGDRLTQYIIYTDYEIYANGSIYSKNRAGSESFSPSLDFDTAKGIFGELKYNQIDEISQNRAHFTASGNKGFFQSTLNTEFPLAEGGITTKQIQDSLENNARAASQRITKGFEELANNKFNFTNRLEEIMQRVLEQQVYSFYKKMINNDFLDKLKNYQKGQKADFNFLYLKDFLKKAQSEEAKKSNAKKSIKKNVNFKAEVKKRTIQYLDKNFTSLLQTYIEYFFRIKFPFKTYNYRKTITIDNFFTEYHYYTRLEYIDLGGDNGVSSKEVTYNTLELKDEFYKLKYSEFYTQFENELLDYEYSILQKTYYKQRSFLYTLEEKAQEHLQALRTLFIFFNDAVEESVYLTQKESVYHIYEEQTKKIKETLNLTKTSFLSLSKQNSNFYVLKNDLFKKDFESFLKTCFNFEDNNALRSFYFNVFLKNLGTINQGNSKFKGFFYKNYLAFLRYESDFEDFKKVIYYDKKLDSFDFNKLEN